MSDYEIVDYAPFFAPVSSDFLDGLLGQYSAARRRIEEIGAIVNGETFGAVMNYFVDGNASEDRRYAAVRAERLFEVAGAVAALNAAYWGKALNLTDVIDYMPQARRDEWHKSIREQTTPDFNEAAVRPTIESMLAMRGQFLAERVDGIFRGLSGEHVTNSPEAFGKRMIIANFNNGYGGLSYQRVGLVNDLRCVIAKFMGRDEPKHDSTQPVMAALQYDTGTWLSVDGGALRIRLYKKGTAHLEVHPDMAWRLNATLASLYPRAIPAAFRERPKKRTKDFVMMGRPLPFAVLALLPAATGRYRRTYHIGSSNSTAAYAEAVRVVEAIGGCVDSAGNCSFEYNPDDVLTEIGVSGCLPDRVAHQYYPTPEKLARICVDLAEIGTTESVLEPSAGQGAIASLLPAERTTCVEISTVYCAILKAKGFAAHQADFLVWAKRTPERFDRIVMNPPFSEGRAMAHVEAAAGLLAAGGILVAVMPSGARNSARLTALDCTWSPIFDNEFAGTSVAVVLLTARLRLTKVATPCTAEELEPAEATS